MLTPIEPTRRLKIPTLGDNLIELGAYPGMGTISSNQTLQLDVNHAWHPDVPQWSSWCLQLNSPGDNLSLLRRAPNDPIGAVSNPLRVDGAGNLSIAGHFPGWSITPGTVGLGQLGSSASLRAFSNAAFPAGWSNTTAMNQWIRIVDVGITLNGSWVLVTAVPGGYSYPNNFASGYYMGIGFDYNPPGPYVRYDVQANSGVTGLARMPMPPFVVWYGPNWGWHVFSVWIYTQVFIYFTPDGNAVGTLSAMEFA